MLDDIHDALRARLEELRPTQMNRLEQRVLLSLAIAYVNERCPKCGDTGWIGDLPAPKECDCNRPALLADAAEKLGIGGQGGGDAK